MKKVLAVAAAVVMLVSFAACKDKGAAKPAAPAQGGAQPQLPAGHPAPGGGQGGVVMPSGELQTVVPDSVKGKWSAVKLIVEDKAANKMQDVSIKLNGEYAVPGSSIKIKVGEFLPDFKMDGTLITSASNEMNNPAVRVTVTDGGKEIFKGWLYSKFPAIHPFQHEKFGLTLKEAVKG